MIKTASFLFLFVSIAVSDYSSKRRSFHSDPRVSAVDSTFKVRAKATTLFEDAFNQLSDVSPDTLRRKILADYLNEDQQVLPLSTSKFLFELQRHALTRFALFKPLPADKTTLMINPDWDPQAASLETFKFIGRIMAMSIIHGVPLRVKLPIFFFKSLMGVACNHGDLVDAYPNMFAALRRIYDGFIDREQHFVVNNRELVAGGANRVVNIFNCKEYVTAMVDYLTYFNVQKQLDALRAGFFGLLPRGLFDGFTITEIKRLFYEAAPIIAPLSEVKPPAKASKIIRSNLSCPSEFPECLFLRQGPAEELSNLEVKVATLRELVGVGAFPKTYITVKRDRLLESTMELTKQWPPESFYRQLNVKFEGENALDVGGVSKELFSLLGKSITDPELGLFKLFSEKSTLVTIDPKANNPADLEKFRFFGKLLAWTLLKGHQLETNVVRYLYKMIKKERLNLDDIKLADEEMYSSYVKMLSYNDEAIEAVSYMTFTGELPDGTECPLKLHGESINLTTKNISEYVSLIAAFKVSGLVKQQMKEIQTGFEYLIDRRLLEPFNAYELDVLINGVPNIDVADWKAHTQYRNYTEDDPTINYFWRVVSNMTPEQRRALLFYTTGQSRTPPGGFANMRFVIKREGSTTTWPKSHTCFNMLDLPPYADEGTLRRSVTQMLEYSTTFDE